ncbi:hypothetical protein VDG1235_2457 [Verrucomicrobiia bacterium DG1235]|nr:hypothetical protein VDG1235_2457 [Verrucomicrobiae bacterium DG1235]
MWPFKRKPKIEVVVANFADELSTRYSPKDGCTKPQLSKTFSDLESDPELWGLLCCLFLNEKELRNEIDSNPTIDWENRKDEAREISRKVETMRSIKIPSSFYESGAGQSGD